MGLASFNRMRREQTERLKKEEKKKQEELGKEEIETGVYTNMSKDELEEYAKEVYGVELDKRKSLKKMVQDLEQAIVEK